jgi:hypothetical protein
LTGDMHLPLGFCAEAALRAATRCEQLAAGCTVRPVLRPVVERNDAAALRKLERLARRAEAMGPQLSRLLVSLPDDIVMVLVALPEARLRELLGVTSP